MYCDMKLIEEEDGIENDKARKRERTSASMNNNGNGPTRNNETRRKSSVLRHFVMLTSSPASIGSSAPSSKAGRRETFASDFVTPGTVSDEGNNSIHSAASMRGKQQKDMKRSITKSRSNKVTSAESGREEMKGRGKGNNRALSEGEIAQMGDLRHEKIREAFQLFDRDGDGRITRAEITRAMQSLGYRPSEEEITEMLDKADFNRNGTIEFEEFLEVMADELETDDARGSVDQELRAMFEIFDLNKDGRITVQELSYVMKTLGENLSHSELEDMMRTADTNGDGIIDFQEFKCLFRMYNKSWNESSFAVATH